MEYRAHEIVLEYIQRHLDKSDSAPQIEVYTVWKCKALQNWKFLISSSLLDGMYYELTFNGDKGEWYLDAYKKFENQVIQEPKEQAMEEMLIDALRKAPNKDIQALLLQTYIQEYGALSNANGEIVRQILEERAEK